MAFICRGQNFRCSKLVIKPHKRCGLDGLSLWHILKERGFCQKMEGKVAKHHHWYHGKMWSKTSPSWNVKHSWYRVILHSCLMTRFLLCNFHSRWHIAQTHAGVQRDLKRLQILPLIWKFLVPRLHHREILPGSLCRSSSYCLWRIECFGLR